MKNKTGLRKTIGLFGGALIFTLLLSAASQQPTVEDRVEAIKQSLGKSMQQIRQYQWTETTVVSYKGEEKSRIQKSCVYGPDGQVQKTQIGEPPEAKKKGGVRGRVVERKTEDIQEYMAQVVDLVHAYVPPSPGRLQICKDAGKASVQILEPNKRVLVQFRDYHREGDVVGIEFDIVNNLLLGYEVASFIDKPEDAVNLDVSFASLADETLYASNIVLDAKAKEVTVNVQNSDYTKISN